ncbi:ferrochelatase [Paenibacillus sp. sgz500958]|uniref:ferrochelatase n=1 Tax=Paenibacillus sp. sgz500958 TaxID=3242475 RepID=UPI0036D2D2D0
MNNPSRIGVIIAQMGTSAAPNAKAVKSYLKEFLSDQRVINYPRVLWQPLLRCIILVVRPRRLAKLYSSIGNRSSLDFPTLKPMYNIR